MVSTEGIGELRAVGSCTSKSPCFETSGSRIDLPSFSHLERLGPTGVRVGAGVILADLLSFLDRQQLALPTIGEWAGQTVGGAISTGSHGGSYRYGSLCSSVAAVTLIDGTGQQRRFERGEPELDFVLPSFGTTGAIIEFELDCEPTFSLSLGRRCVSFDDYLDDLVGNPQHLEFRSAIWIPAASAVIDYGANRVSPTTGYQTPREVRFSNTAVVFDWLSRQPAKRSPPGLRTAFESLVRGRDRLRHPLGLLFPNKQYLGSYQEMLAPLSGTAAEILAKRKKNRTPPEGEFAVATDAAPSMLRELDRIFRARGLAPDRPVGLRPGIEENGALAATSGGPCIWVSMFVGESNPLLELLPDLLVRHRARPHWGKCVFHRADDIPALYPRWREFCEFRRELDPNRTFVNRFAADFGI